MKLENEKLRSKNKELKHMLKDSQLLNMELQNQVVGDMQVQLSRLTNREVLREDEQLGYPPVAFVRSSDNFVHIGRDVWLRHEIYDTVVFTSTTPSLFAKQMAVSVFGGRILKNSSVTGRVSNRKINKEDCPPARPKLDSTKLLAIEDIFRHWLKNHKKCNSIQINAYVNKLPTYITKKISQMNAKETANKKIKKIDISNNNGDDHEKDHEDGGATVSGDIGQMANAILASSDSSGANNSVNDAEYTDSE